MIDLFFLFSEGASRRVTGPWCVDRDGFELLGAAVGPTEVEQLKGICRRAFEGDSHGILARSSRGQVYAARNLIDAIPEVTTVWQNQRLLCFLRSHLGNHFGMVRVLFFDKPPNRTWALAWHKDTAIAVENNSISSSVFSRPTVKAGVPHVVASDEVLRRMLTLRVHLDLVTDENGPLRVVPRSHESSESEGVGIENAVAIHAKPGDVLAMRPLITHGSGASRPGTSMHRRVLHLEFAADRDLPDGYQWHDFVSAQGDECAT